MSDRKTNEERRQGLSRRDFLRVGGAGVAGLGGLATLGGLQLPSASDPQRQDDHPNGHGAAGTAYGRRRSQDFFVEHLLDNSR